MGDRGQILIKDIGVYLYTHWSGCALKALLQDALAKRWRWNDEEYLARIIFDVMSDGSHGEETGFGIGTTEHNDLNNPLLVVDCKKQVVSEIGEEGINKSWSFEEFLKLKIESGE